MLPGNCAIVAKANAAQWRRGALVILEARGFPKIDALHGGRPVPLVLKWYNQYFGMDRRWVISSSPSMTVQTMSLTIASFGHVDPAWKTVSDS